jgi:hypothetical protein
MRKLSHEKTKRILSGGSEPVIDLSLKGDELDGAVEKAMYWYRQNFKIQTAKDWVERWLRSQGQSEDADICHRADKYYFKVVAPYCRMASRGVPLGAAQQKQLDELVANARQHKPSIAPETPSVRDRVLAKANAILTELEPVLDSTMDAVQRKTGQTPLKAWISSQNLNRPTIGVVKERLERSRDEYRTALDGDPDYKEAYCFLNKRQLKTLLGIFEDGISELNNRLGVLRATRKPRRAKPKSADTLVKKLNYLQRNAEWGVDSVRPEVIIGSQGLIVFNTHNNKATVFVASEPKAGLSVKGSTVTGWDTEKSFEKTVRKPDEFAKNKGGCRKSFASAVRYLNGVKTKGKPPTGRINAHCLLLQVN